MYASLINRRTNRLSGDFAIPTATQPFLKSVSDEAVQETRGTFEEPQPKGISSTSEPYTSAQYPYNHVFESESGHIRNYTQKIHKNLRTRVGAGSAGGNLEEEIMGNHAYNIKGFVRGNVGPLEGQAAPGEGDVDINIVGNETHIVGKNITLHAETDVFLSSNATMAMMSKSDMQISTASGIVSMKSGSKLDIQSTTTTNVVSGTSMTQTSGTTLDSTAGTVYTIKSGGGSPTATNKVDINPD